jgi:D-xylose 1-dehydrogenase (NADP+, D-xylono-1,5-lactone-forming)
MANKILNWGLLSTANINHALFLPLRTSSRNRLLAIASRDQVRAEAYAHKFRIARAYGSYEELLADPDIDVIYNPLPNHLHAEWTIKAMEAGKHVLCEKPFALTVDEVDSVTAAAKHTGKVAAEAFMYRSHPQTRKVKEIVESGTLGKVQVIRGAFRYWLGRDHDYRLDPTMGGGGLWDVGCYLVSYARLIAGEEPAEVFGWQVTGPTGVDESFTGQLRFPGGIHALFDVGMNSKYRTFLEIVGSAATLRVPNPFVPLPFERIFLIRRVRMKTIFIRGQYLYNGEVEDMANAALLGKPQHISLADTRANVATLVALLESARIGKPVSL